MSEKDGGSAFPRIDVEHVPSSYGHGAHCETDNLPGMSLRDYFAAQAMAAYLTSPATAQDATNNAAKTSEWAYIQADAMLQERAK